MWLHSQKKLSKDALGLTASSLGFKQLDSAWIRGKGEGANNLQPGTYHCYLEWTDDAIDTACKVREHALLDIDVVYHHPSSR